jgi:hypothetical protein
VYARADLPVVTNERLDEAITKLLPTHMQLIMGIGTAEELALAEVKAAEAMKRTVVQGRDDRRGRRRGPSRRRCPVTGHVEPRERARPRTLPSGPARRSERLGLVPLIARPLARNTVEKFARNTDLAHHDAVMDENKQAMVEADEFDMDTMLVMFKELQTKQLRAAAEGVDGLSDEMRRFIEEAKAAGVTRCPIRDIEQKHGSRAPVDFRRLAGGRAAGRRAVPAAAARRLTVAVRAPAARVRRLTHSARAGNARAAAGAACRCLEPDAALQPRVCALLHRGRPWHSAAGELSGRVPPHHGRDHRARAGASVHPERRRAAAAHRPREIAAYAVARGATVVVGTNGIGLSDDRIRSLIDAGVTGVAVSIDSLDARYHDRFRHGAGALADTMAAVERLRAHGWISSCRRP